VAASAMAARRADVRFTVEPFDGVATVSLVATPARTLSTFSSHTLATLHKRARLTV
jgi:hypothetical protein